MQTSRSWSFRLVHEPDPVLAANVRWLSGYRHPRYLDQGLAPLLRQVFAEGAGLLDGVSHVADPIRGLPVLFDLLWDGRPGHGSGPVGRRDLGPPGGVGMRSPMSSWRRFSPARMRWSAL